MSPKPWAQYEKPYCAWTLNPRPHSQAVVAVIPDRFSLKACRGPISQGFVSGRKGTA